MTEQQILWVLAAKQIGADPEDHEDDDAIQPIYDELKEQFQEWKGKLQQ
jgi:hypothetical protein